MKKGLLIVIIFLFIFSMTCSASELSDTQRIYFDDDIEYLSDENSYNWNLLGNCIKNVYMELMLSNKPITLVVEWKNNSFSKESLNDQVDILLEAINSDTGLVFGSIEEPMTKKDLVVKSCDIATGEYAGNSRNLETLNLLNVDKVCNLIHDRKHSQNININSNNLKSDNIFVIDGSYHDYSSQPRRWYNQITDSFTDCDTNISSPHLGDGNNRFDSGYQWFPEKLDVTFQQRPWQGKFEQSIIYMSFIFTENTLKNLNVDNDEALEMEIIFYNYNNSNEPIETRGHSFMPEGNVTSYYSNLPGYYLDTTFGDNEYEDSYCIGCSDTTLLEADVSYYWYIIKDGFVYQDGCPNDGRYRITAQRSYAILSMSQ